MSSREYHKCMNEVYFTRALMWMLYAGVVLKLDQSGWAVLTAVVCGILSASYAYRSFKEFGRAI